MLYNFLTDNENRVISTAEPLDNFKKAFSGEIILEPLKIKWLFPNKHGDIKPVILKVISLLMFELKILEEIPVQLQLAKTIEIIFCDKGGKPIRNTNVTISQRLKTQGVIKYIVLDKLIENLRKVPFSVNSAKNQ